MNKVEEIEIAEEKEIAETQEIETPETNEPATMEPKKIELTVKECTNKTTNKKFLAYKVTTKNGRYMDCKFRQTVTPPKENGYIYVMPNQMNVASNQKYPCLWVKKIEKFVSKEELAEELISAMDYAELNDIF